MSRIGFVVLYAPGHINPSLTLARALARAGHEIVFFNLPDIAAVAPDDLRFVSFGEAEFPPGSLRISIKKTGELSGPPAMAFYIERMTTLLQASLKHLPDLLRRESLDLLVVDQLFPGASTVADHLKLPFVSLANALHVNREPTVPPPLFTWPYDPSPAGIERNAQGWAGVAQFFKPLLDLVNIQRAAWNLRPYTDFLEDSFSPWAQISQTPAAFDLPRPQAPATLHRVGHLPSPAPTLSTPFPWDWLDSGPDPRPLLYASLGTLQNRIPAVFRAIIDACAPLQAQTVVILGREALDPALFEPLPSNILLVPFAPQLEIIRRATLCITHAGLNTALDCVSAGVPMVAIPIASEQPGVAARIVHHGLGAIVSLAELSAQTLAAAIAAVLGDRSFRARAHALAAEVSRLDPVEESTRIIDRILEQQSARPGEPAPAPSRMTE